MKECAVISLNLVLKYRKENNVTQEEIIKFLKDNMRLSWEYRNGKYYIVLKVAGEKITELNFGEGY